MDLGSSVCTSRNPNCSICPLEKECMKYITEVEKKQTPFKNSNREKRGEIVGILTSTRRVHSSELGKKLKIKESRLNEILLSLEKDGIINIAKNKYIEIQSN